MKLAMLSCVTLCASPALPWLLSAAIAVDAKEVDQKVLRCYVGGAVCEEGEADGIPGCQACQPDNPNLVAWQGCSMRTKYKCVPFVNGPKVECLPDTDVSCGGVQYKFDDSGCGMIHMPSETRPCTIVYKTSVDHPLTGWCP